MRRSFQFLLCAFLLLGGAAGCEKSTVHLPNNMKISESWENGLNNWEIRSLDVLVGETPIDWHIEQSQQRASEGNYSIELYMDNLTDAAKIWVERSIDVEPDKTHIVKISFDLATADAGAVNNFQIIALPLAQSPQTVDEVIQGVAGGDFPEGTYNGGVDGYVWVTKSITKEVTADNSGKIYIALGIWGTWEGPRTYYLDNISVSLVFENMARVADGSGPPTQRVGHPAGK